MATPLVTCRCGKPSDGTCQRLATQEDFLCDVCRRPGCTTFTIPPQPGQRGSVQAHYEIRKWDEGRFDGPREVPRSQDR